MSGLSTTYKVYGGFPQVSGYSCDGVVNPSHLGLGRQSVALPCYVSGLSVGRLIKWGADFGYVGIPISNTTKAIFEKLKAEW